jgi:preprotein translocase subunit SecE
VSSSVRCQEKGEGFVAKSKEDKKGQENRIVKYLRETWFELKKVSWPTRSEAVNLTLMVIVATTALSMVLAIMDLVIERAFGLFL